MKKPLKNNVYIIEGLRTAIGSPFKSLKEFTVPEMAGSVLRALVRKTKVKKNAVDEVFFGNVVGAGLGQNLARQVAIAGGLPATVPALTVNNVCGAGLQTVILAARSLVTDNAKLIICGGAESATHNPYYIEGDMEQSFNPRDVKDSLIHDGLICAITKKHMGELAEAMAKRHNISRAEQDLFALQSHLKAVRAQENKIFEDEIVPLKLGAKNFFCEDERPRRKISIENFKTLRPAFVRGGTVTAGNASAPADGAAACLLASKAGVKDYALKPRARILAEATIAVDPLKAFEACVQAIRVVIKKGGLTG
ncbi:MAG: thiolase family protein, partial [Candidatus Omnitrophica bacterium]|nr:thiolase family protein [Candidatus Omnitrophota bacterium]